MQIRRRMPGALCMGRPVFYTMKRNIWLPGGIFLLLMTVWFFTRPCFFVSTDEALMFAIPVKKNETLSIRFVHSVQKTVVLENLHLDLSQKKFILDSTKYQSFGVGLPFLAQEGRFRREGEYFIMDHMDREFPSLELRTGLGTKLTLLLRGKEYPVYKELPAGSRLNLTIAPYFQRWRYLCPE